MVGLAGMEDRGVDQISGGQRQRVALARTLAMEPKLVLLDEPLGALDANLRGRMRNELRAIRERLGVTFLHVTGSENEALAMGDRVVVLDRGRIIQSGTADQVYDTPASPDVVVSSFPTISTTSTSYTLRVSICIYRLLDFTVTPSLARLRLRPTRHEKRLRLASAV